MRRHVAGHALSRKWQISTSLALALWLGWALAACSSKANPAKRPEGGGVQPVTVTRVVQRDVPIDLQIVGNVEAYLTVVVKAQVSGELTQVHFHEGNYVHKGDLLFSVDPRMLQAQLTQAQANLARDEAQLAQAEATLAKDDASEKYARSESARYMSLLGEGLISKEQAEQYRSQAESSQATVRADEAAVRSARSTVAAQRAAVENIRVQFDYTSIRSPIDGRTGNLNVKQGNVVTANMTDLITIHQVQPIYVSFSIPEARRREVRLAQLVTASPQNDTAPAASGELTFIDNSVDPTTGTIRLKGTFRNSDQKLWPGEFVRTTLRLRTEPGAVVLPNQAVQTGQDGVYVYVVKPDRTVEARPVVTGTRVDQDMVIEKGLRPGETVVLEGQLRLAPGSRVQVAGEGRGAGKEPGQRPMP
jgi:multidrug efflux system membrane fusion protein